MEISGVRKSLAARHRGFQKGGFGGCSLDTQSLNEGTKTEQRHQKKPERGYKKNGTTVQKTGTRAQSPKPP